MRATPILPSFDPTRRQVLPLSEAVRAPRFKRRDWQLSAQVREVADSFELPRQPSPPVDDDAHGESIVMQGAEIRNTLRTGSHVVTQKRIADLGTLPELAIIEAPQAFERAPTLLEDADAALNRLATRANKVRRAVRPEPVDTSRPSSFTLAIAVIGVGLLCIYALYMAARASLHLT